MSFQDAFYESVMKEEKSKEESLELLEDMRSSWKREVADNLLVSMGNSMSEAAEFPREAGDKSRGR